MFKNSYKFGVICTVIGGILWGFSGACGQFLFMQKNITSDLLVPFRLLMSGIFMLIFFAYKQKMQIFIIFKNSKDIFTLFLYAVIGLGLCQYTYFYSIELSNAAVATVIQYSAPAMILIFVTIKNKKMPKLVEILALICAALGVFLLATHGKFDTLILSQKALIACLICAFATMCYNLIPTSINEKYSVCYCLAWGLFLAGILAIFIFRVWEQNFIYDFESFFAFFVIVFLGTIAAFSLYMTGVFIIGPSRASLLACFEPLSAAFFAFFWLNTPLIWIDVLGFLLILCCTFLLRK